MLCMRRGSAQEANPLASALKAMPARDARRLAHSWPLTHTLAGVGKVGADLHEPGAEVWIEDVEIVAAHPAVGLGEGVVHGPRLVRPLVAGEHLLELLGHPDGHHPRLRGPVQVRAHDLDVALPLLEPDRRDVLLLGECGHGPTERGADLVEQGRGGKGVAEVLGEERHHLAAHLQVGDVGVEVDAV